MPSVPAFRRSEIGLDYNTDLYANPQTNQMQVVERLGARWRARFDLPPMKRDQLAAWQAFLTNLNGQSNTFLAYDPDGFTPRGLNTQVPTSLNLILNNRDYTGWTLGGATVTADATISPEGLLNADAIVRTVDTTNNGRILYSALSLVAGTWVFSALLKREAGTNATIQIGDGSGSAEVFYNFTTNVCTPNSFGGTPPTGVTAGSIILANGWVVVFLVFTIAATRSFTPRIAEGLTNAGGQTIGNRLFVFGAQLENQPARTPTILQGGTAIARPAGIFVYGAGQTGSTLRVRGFTDGTTSILAAGDYIGVGGKMYMLTAPAITDFEGATTLAITPMLASSPADGAAVTTQGVTCEMRLVDAGQASWQTDAQGVCQGLTFSAVEAL